MTSNNKPRKEPFRIMILLAMILIAASLLTSIAYAQAGGLLIYLRSDAPTELFADGKSQTTAMVDLSGCAWYPSAGSEDLIQIEFKNDLGLFISPPFLGSTIGDVGSPFEIDITAGTQYGIALISAEASYCSEGNVMVFGVCSSEQEQNNPKCLGNFEVTVHPADGSEAGENLTEDSEDTSELNVSISCSPNPTTAKTVSCTASVSGSKQGETLEYLWALDGTAGSKTSSNTYSWKGEETGYYTVSVEVFGQDRKAFKSLVVEVNDPGTSGEEENGAGTANEADPEVSTLVSSLESFLKAGGISNIDPARLAVAGAGVSALIAIWMIVNHRAGVPIEKLEQAVGQWRWKEGAELPEVEKKTTPKPPEKLPEAEKATKESKPPSSLPEQKDSEEGVKATASAALDVPATEDSAPPSPAKKPTGEGLEEWLERKVDDAEGYRDAVDKTITEFKKRLEDVPKEVKESKFWKEKVAPKLKKLDDMGIESKSGKLKEYLRITKELLEVRKKVDADLSMLSEKDREGIVWLERGLQGGEEALKKLHNTLITDPAIAAAKSVLPKDQAAAAEKILKQHQADIEKMLTGIKKLPRKFAENVAKAQHRDLNVGIIKNDTNQVFQHEGFKDRYPPNFGKGLDKARNAYQAVSNAAGRAKKWLGQYIWQLRDVPPAP